MKVEELPIHLDSEDIARFCEEHGIVRLALFGSVLRRDFGEQSDVDVLVEYESGRHPGLMLFRQQEDLAARFARMVDLHTAASLSPFFRERVVASSVPIYERA